MTSDGDTAEIAAGGSASDLNSSVDRASSYDLLHARGVIPNLRYSRVEYQPTEFDTLLALVYKVMVEPPGGFMPVVSGIVGKIS